jgi:hypothetical protein|tara:strand:- start:9600 stop:10178 length:579 start_codon:yes stop_codon:yes gene_type:complete
MKISVNINGVLRNVLLKFQQVYEKYEDRDVKSDVITPNLMEYTHFDDEEKLYNFLYQEAPMEIFGQAKETFINVISHLVELYKNMPSDYKLRVVSDDLGKAKPATLWFLAKYGLVCDEIVFYNTKTLENIWDNTDVFITSDVDVIESKPKNKKLIVVDQSYNNSYDCDLRITNLKELDTLNIEDIWRLKEIH